MGFWIYYLAIFLIAYLVQYPWLIAAVVVFFVLRKVIPDPWVWIRTAGRIRALKQQIDANPSNATARRDLARIYLQRLRPRAALRLLDEARQRREDAETLFLTGTARYRAGDAQGALEPLVKSVELDPRTSFGEAYLVAGDALRELDRLEESEDAYERYVDFNTSSIEGFTKLALVRRRKGARSEARQALDEALRTWTLLPRFGRRKQVGWWLRAQAARTII
jgi:tetratricopeptide (TPR) repeat protein